MLVCVFITRLFSVGRAAESPTLYSVMDFDWTLFCISVTVVTFFKGTNGHDLTHSSDVERPSLERALCRLLKRSFI